MTYPSFAKMRQQAADLYKTDPKEVGRHARVSIDNRHKCQECFTCACAEIVREKRQAGRYDHETNEERDKRAIRQLASRY